MNATTNQFCTTLKHSWMTLVAWTLVFFICTFTYLTVQKPRYEMTILVPAALEAYSFDVTSLTELIRQYSTSSFSGGITSDLRKKYGEKWNAYASIGKRDLVITQRGNIFIIHARSNDQRMAKELGETMASFIQSTKGQKILEMKEKAHEYADFEQRLKTDLSTGDALMKESQYSRNLPSMIAFYDARQLNYENLISVDQLLLQADKFVQMHEFLDGAKKTEPIKMNNHPIINSLLAGCIGLLFSFFVFSIAPAHKQ